MGWPNPTKLASIMKSWNDEEKGLEKAQVATNKANNHAKEVRDAAKNSKANYATKIRQRREEIENLY